jgi:polysaccharide pyruvyl transferase CsaB
MLTNWGSKTLVVSEDIKKYLLDNYKINEEDISVTINGIDTRKFYKSNYQCDDIIKEFCFDITRKHIVCVSRLDKSRSLAAHILLNISQEVYKDYNADIIIVGDGDDFCNLKAQADDINRALNKKIVYLIGRRTDVEKFLAFADVFVGVSRAALEAMAAMCPVILFGNEGYGGIFTQDKFFEAREDNFCCRSSKTQINKNKLEDKLKEDIKKIFLYDKQRMDLITDNAHGIIKKYYSVETMCNDALEVYKLLLHKAELKCDIDIMISGYYGFNNSGDDYILKAIIQDLKKNIFDIKILVLSNNPTETKKNYNVEAIHRLNIFAIRSYMKRTRLLISGGGSLIQDVTSTHSLRYYLWIIKQAIKYSTRVMLYANGIGPIIHNKNKKLAAKILNKADLITLRDKQSMCELIKIGVNKPDMLVTADAVFSLKCAIHKKNFFSEKKYFVVAIRQWKYNSSEFEKKIASLIEYVSCKYDMIPVLLAMHPACDAFIMNNIENLIKKVVAKCINADYSINCLSELISNAEFVFAMRLHTVIYAIQTATPILALVYDPKVKGMMQEINQSFYLDIDKLDLDILKNMVAEILKGRDRISSDIKSAYEDLRKRSMRNTNLSLDLLNSFK